MGHSEKTLCQKLPRAVWKNLSQIAAFGPSVTGLVSPASGWSWDCVPVGLGHIPHVPEIGQNVPDCSHLSPQAMRAPSQKKVTSVLFTSSNRMSLGAFGLWVFSVQKALKKPNANVNTLSFK